MRETKQTTKPKEMYPLPVFSDELFLRAFEAEPSLNEELLQSAAFPSTPLFHLESCLQLYNKTHLQELAEDHGLYLPVATKKGELVKQLAQTIEKRFGATLPYLPVANLEFLTRFSQDKPDVEIRADQLQYRDISHAHNFGFLFLFKKKDVYTAVVPKELLGALQLLQEQKMWRLAHLHQRMDAYAIALSNLYGVLDIDQYAIVWNRYENEMLTPAMVGDELRELGRVQYYWWFEDELIISSFFRSLDEVEEFLIKVKDVSYYLPSREELIAFYQTPYEEDSPSVHAMMEFLAGYRLGNGEQVEDLMDEISDSVIVGNGMQEAFNLLNEYGLLFEGMEEINRFTELYSQMSDSIRKWELKGHTLKTLQNIHR
ncbi:MAG: hypothetical protein ACOXZ4_04175 [Sphaerochaetaceae bacterium]